MASLPAPSPEAQDCSHRLSALIREQIALAGGDISFSHYMRMALYTPGLGYYSGGSRKFGAAGDFITAPEMTPLFAHALAQPVAEVLAAVRQQTGSADMLEVGGGSGRLAVDLLQALAALGELPRHYYLLELSAELMERQRDALAQAVPHLLERVIWLQALPVHFSGCIIGNEVLDAMPCQLVKYHNEGWLERRVTWQEGFAWQDRPAQLDPLLAAIPFDALSEGYTTEYQAEACAFVASLYDITQSGALLLIDYGFEAATYYHPEREQGTLMCHYRHHSHSDPFYLPGLQDITTHIDFSAIWRTADQAGWLLEGYASQAGFLLDAGILDRLAALEVGSAAYLKASVEVQKLLSPAEMGELFKVIAFSRQLPLTSALAGFRREDRSGGL